MTKTLSLVTAFFLLMTGAWALGHEPHEPKAKKVTLIGEVIDTVCYVSHESRGPEHAPCARACAEQGISLGILEEKTGKVYISLPVDHTNPNAKLMNFIAQRVKVTGTVFSRGGLTGIYIKTVEPAAK